MKGAGGVEGWGEDDDDFDSDEEPVGGEKGGREGKWETGKGRCAVTGRRVLAGTQGLRRVMI